MWYNAKKKNIMFIIFLLHLKYLVGSPLLWWVSYIVFEEHSSWKHKNQVESKKLQCKLINRIRLMLDFILTSFEIGLVFD